jgi:hypothetical protein
MGVARTLFSELSTRYDFKYQNGEEARQRTGTLSQVSEVRIGNTSITHKKKTDLTEEIQIEIRVSKRTLCN